jgi:predicted XRE-type DNA-binding protein
LIAAKVAGLLAEGLLVEEQLLTKNEERPGYQKKYSAKGLKRITPDDIQEWATDELEKAMEDPAARTMFWVGAYVSCKGKIGGYVYNSLQNVRKRRSQQEIQEEQKRWDNLRQHYGHKLGGEPDDSDPDAGDVWRPNDPERPENVLLRVDLERLRARFPILEMIDAGLTQTEIGKILGISQQRVSDQLKKIAQWYRSH